MLNGLGTFLSCTVLIPCRKYLKLKYVSKESCGGESAAVSVNEWAFAGAAVGVNEWLRRVPQSALMSGRL
jgi:hypothetical protein